MTTSGFDYGSDDESVVARLSIDIPTDGIQTLRELTNETQRLRVEMEASSRATGNFLEYLKQLPQIQNQIVQAQRALTSQLERTIEAEQRLTAGGIAGVPTGTYQQPWAGVSSGMGGRAPTMSDISYQTGQLDTRTLYMMNNERPTGLRPGDMNPQVSSDEMLTEDSQRATARDAAQAQQVVKHPGAKSGGSPTGLAAKAKMMEKLSGPLMKELGAGGSPEGILKALSGMSGGLGALFGGGEAAAAGGEAAAAGAAGGGGALAALGPIGAAIGAAAAGLGIFEKGGNVVEGWRKMGQVRGGGWHEGAADEGKIMTMALNPFISMEQARKIVQGSLSEGYTGKEFDTVTGFVAGNLKSMNMDITESFALMRKNIIEGGATTGDVKGTLSQMQQLSKTGYMGMPERMKEFQATSEGMVNAGYTGQQADQFSLNAQQMFSGDKTLMGLGSSMAQAGMTNDTSLMVAAHLEGIQVPPGTLPNEYGAALAEMGKDPTQVMSDFIKRLAQMAQQASGGNDTHGAARFQLLLRHYAPDLKTADGTLLAQDFTACRKLYLEYVGGSGDPYQSAAQTASKGQQAPTPPTATHHPAPGRSPSPPQAQAMAAYSGPGVEVVDDQGGAEPYQGTDQQRSQLANGDTQWRHKGDQGGGTRLANTPAQTVNYYGSGGGAGQPSHVQGTLNINVNPSEFQRALGVPTQVPLGPNEIQANQGYGTAQRNAPPPGYGR